VLTHKNQRIKIIKVVKEANVNNMISDGRYVVATKDDVAMNSGIADLLSRRRERVEASNKLDRVVKSADFSIEKKIDRSGRVCTSRIKSGEWKMRVCPLGNKMVYEQPGFVGISPVEFKLMIVS